MSTIAKGEITLSPVNDAYTVAITPSSCVIRADFDGSNPKLDKAEGVITVMRGNKRVPFKITTPHISTSGIEFSVQTSISNLEHRFNLIHIPNTISEGWMSFDILTQDGFNYSTNVRFPFTVVRESTMLDWIQDWEGTKTKIGGTYIMTPKLFVGKKEEILTEVNGEMIWCPGELTGVYIGPDLLSFGESSAGIYGYLKDKEIFHINADGGYIGGWSFNNAGLQSGNGVVNILSEGSIFAQNPTSTTPYWSLMANGSATFANGNVRFDSDGNAEYKGKIIASSGGIGNWTISTNQIHNSRIILDSDKNYIGVLANPLIEFNLASGDISFSETPIGVKMWYNSASDFGFVGWNSESKKVFQLGSINVIAGWQFNHQALWTGSAAPLLIQGAYTEEGTLTISTTGIRGYRWYMDANGTAAFVGGSVKFNTDKGEMFGWLMRSGRFSSKHAAAISNTYDCGFYVSPTDISEVSSSSLRTTISNNGGIYMFSDGSNSILRAYDKNGNLGFRLSTDGIHQIGNWNFNNVSIYTGSTTFNDHGFASDANSLIISTNGLIGCLWKLMADGSGAVAGNNIRWDAQGDVTFSSNVKLEWASITGGPNLTQINENGLYTGTISADKITTGTISTASIKSEGKWSLNTDGSGSLASGNIHWTKDGVLSVQKAVLTNVQINGTIRQPWSQSGSYLNLGDGEKLTFDNIVAGTVGDFADGDIASMLTWELQDSGRLIRIANWRWGDVEFGWRNVELTAPDGKYFFEDGIAKNKLVLNRQIIEMIGYGDNSTFYGWVIINRVNFKTQASYGRRLNCLAMGIVSDNGGTTPGIQYSTFDGSSITVSRTGTGVYELVLPSAWQLEADGYQVMLTGFGPGCMKGTLASRTPTKCVVHVSDDYTPNNGSFQFQIFNTNDWIG